MENSLLGVEKEGRIGWITLLQPTITPELIREFHRIMDSLEQDEEVWVIIIKGSGGKMFFTGYNLNLMLGGEPNIGNLKGAVLDVQSLMDRVEHCIKPVIAAVDGFALGGGLELVMACDLVVASTRSMFGLPEVRVGLIPAAGGTMRLHRHVSKHRAMEMALTGRMYKAEDAYNMGLVNKVVEPEAVIEEAKKLALEIASNAPIAVRAAKATTVFGHTLFDRQVEHFTVEETLKCLVSQDLQEGVKAFIEKRKADFKNR